MLFINKMLSIGQVAKALGVTIQTLHNWDKKGLTRLLNLVLDGARSKKNKKLLDDMQKVVIENVSEK